MPSLTSLTKSILNTVSQQSNDAYLIELDGEGRPKLISAANASEAQQFVFAFQYFPESVSDNKAINYQTKEIPGASLPLYQWISGGERTLTFTTTFTTDVDLLTENSPDGISARISGASGDIVDRLRAAGVSRRNVDIRAAVARLRRFMYPDYSEQNVTSGSPLTIAPAKLRLVLVGSGIGLAGASSSSFDSVRCIMTQCDVTWEAFFPSGLPRIVTVQLAFAEVAQFGGFIEFPQRSNISSPRNPFPDTNYHFTPRVKGVGGNGGGTGNF